jgi:hypothetical protein
MRFPTSALLLASLGERDPRWLADSALLYLSRQRLSRTRRAIIPKVARRLGFVLKPHSRTARYCTVRKLNIWSAYERRAVLYQLFAERRALHHGAISHPPLRHVAH